MSVASKKKLFAKIFFLALALNTCAWAAPPFISDDPEATPYHHYDFYIFTALDKNNVPLEEPDVSGPAVELDWGALPNLELHLMAPYAWTIPMRTIPAANGIGDIEAGVKYRFIQEGKHSPQIAFVPMLELPTGNTTLNLGNGRLWMKLPIWLKKTWGAWSADGGGGYALNSEPGTLNYPYAGLQVQRQMNNHLSLGTEIFTQGPSTVLSQASTIMTVGATYNFTKHFSLLGSVGHSIIGEEHLTAYLGLYWTGGLIE